METRRTRFVCVSDTHNAKPGGAFRLPKGDVLIHAGDLTNQGSYAELKKSLTWLEEADFEVKIVVAGNHDITLDTPFYAQHGPEFHNQALQNAHACQRLLMESTSITYLKHESANIHLSSQTGPGTTFKIFGSPYSPMSGRWAFGYTPEQAIGIWSDIPIDTDVVVTHTPPTHHLDTRSNGISVGCAALCQRLWEVRPRLAICGHVHESRGAERVRWNLGRSNNSFPEASVVPWSDPGQTTKKLSLVDLSSRSKEPFENDGCTGNYDAEQEMGTSWRPSDALEESSRGRPGRQETCVINAAIMATSWPHSPRGGKTYNKPIVVDIDLPVFRSDT